MWPSASAPQWPPMPYVINPSTYAVVPPAYTGQPPAMMATSASPHHPVHPHHQGYVYLSEGYYVPEGVPHHPSAGAPPPGYPVVSHGIAPAALHHHPHHHPHNAHAYIGILPGGGGGGGSGAPTPSASLSPTHLGAAEPAMVDPLHSAPPYGGSMPLFPDSPASHHSLSLHGDDGVGDGRVPVVGSSHKLVNGGARPSLPHGNSDDELALAVESLSFHSDDDDEVEDEIPHHREDVDEGVGYHRPLDHIVDPQPSSPTSVSSLDQRPRVDHDGDAADDGRVEPQASTSDAATTMTLCRPTLPIVHARKLRACKKLNADRSSAIARVLASALKTCDSAKSGIHPHANRLEKMIRHIVNDRWRALCPKVSIIGEAALNLVSQSAPTVTYALSFDGGNVDGKPTSTREVGNKELMHMISAGLEMFGMKRVDSNECGSVPSVHFDDPASGLAAKICVKDRLGMYYTKLLQRYFSIDDRAARLCCIVVNWAGVHQLLPSLSALSWSMVVVAFLQLRTPAVLPCLQQVPDERYAGGSYVPLEVVQGCDVSFCDDGGGGGLLEQQDVGGKRPSLNEESLEDLLVAFFHFFAWEFHGADVLSVRCGHLLKNKRKRWAPTTAGIHPLCIASRWANGAATTRRVAPGGGGSMLSNVCIEDPWDPLQNVGGWITAEQAAQFRAQCKQMYTSLLGGGGSAASMVVDKMFSSSTTRSYSTSGSKMYASTPATSSNGTFETTTMREGKARRRVSRPSSGAGGVSSGGFPVQRGAAKATRSNKRTQHRHHRK